MSSNRYVTMAPMLAGPLLIALAEPLSPIDTGSDTPAERLGSILANPGRYGLTVACLLAGMLLLVPAVLTTSQAVTGRGQRTAQVGAVLAATGFMLFAVNIGAVGIGPTAWASLPEGQQAALVPAFTAMDEARGLMPLPVFGSFLPPLVGMLTLAVGAVARACGAPLGGRGAAAGVDGVRVRAQPPGAVGRRAAHAGRVPPADRPAPSPDPGGGGGGGAVSDLNVLAWGAGEPVVLVHGSFGWGEETWAQQRPLAGRFRLLLLDRRGFGGSPPAEREDFGVDAANIAEVLGDGAHLVGHSYGGLGCLLAAARRPDAVWSLTVIEPPAFGVARGNPAVERLLGRLRSLLHARGLLRRLPPGAGVGAAGGRGPVSPGVARSTGPKGARGDPVLHGPAASLGGGAAAGAAGRRPVPQAGRLGWLGPGLGVGQGPGRGRARCRLRPAGGTAGARRAVVRGARHSPQLTHPEDFNPQLVAFLASSSRSRLPTP
jgi:pimeloyl-ACP methyl ester carboxylesterase